MHINPLIDFINPPLDQLNLGEMKDDMNNYEEFSQQKFVDSPIFDCRPELTGYKEFTKLLSKFSANCRLYNGDFNYQKLFSLMNS